jgi:hypothetical protein
MDRKVDGELIFIAIVKNIMDVLFKIKLMDMEDIIFYLALNMKEIGTTVLNMELGFSNSLTETCTEVHLGTINFMVMVFMNTKMVIYLKENGRQEKEMVVDNLKELMDIYKLVHGMMINFKFDFFFINILYIVICYFIFFFK